MFYILAFTGAVAGALSLAKWSKLKSQPGAHHDRVLLDSNENKEWHDMISDFYSK
ncbi:hypothetical protein UFOVP1264_72 [uncultured Caudovirales phage]|uniref:Uncharacterized protein n=1 Tax=uncultured Caudovirales phage TaxID=2100421 RepID=A0A6J5RK87_9CAUD|nr:hypothetical protein UFOVP1264_72 [uncultured Caudovirales phage]